MDRIRRLAADVLAGDRRSLARAITLVESRRQRDWSSAALLMDSLLHATGSARRVGITGLPGAGKSTLIDELGDMLVERGERVAVLAIDPTSDQTGGSILGDKTRMVKLGRRAQAFIRPTPSGNRAGGVAQGTMDALLLCEAAGYSNVVVETLGVGQGEKLVSALCDVLVCVTLAGGGDELSALKRGLYEICDIMVFNKADETQKRAVEEAAHQYRLFCEGRRRRPDVHAVSARTGAGLDELWRDIEASHRALSESGQLATRRRAQQKTWFAWTLEEKVASLFACDPELKAETDAATELIDGGKTSVYSAVQRVVAAAEKRLQQSASPDDHPSSLGEPD